MRDPYHNARLRFKVARDRLIEQQMEEHAFGDLVEYRADLEATLTLDHKEPNWSNKRREFRNPFYDEFLQAAGILLTMEKWKITDERQALMVYKLSRS